MHDTSPPPLAALYGAMAAHMNGDDDGLALLLHEVLAQCEATEFAHCAAMTTGEYLRAAADLRALPVVRLIELLSAAHGNMIPTDRWTGEGLILNGTRRYVLGQGRLWTDAEGVLIAKNSLKVMVAGVRVASAAISWRANDMGERPADLVARTCLALADRETLPG